MSSCEIRMAPICQMLMQKKKFRNFETLTGMNQIKHDEEERIHVHICNLSLIDLET